MIIRPRAQTRDLSSSGQPSSVTVASLAALKALTSRPASVVTQYRATAGDGGGGTWVWRTGDQSANVSADTLSGLWAAPDSASTGASGAWQRVYEGSANLLWFGADSTGVADSAPAFAAAAAAGVVTCYVPPGLYYWDSSQTLTKSCLFIGAGWNERNNAPNDARQGTWIYQDDTTITPVTFSLAGSAGTRGFQNIAFEQSHPTPGGGWTPTVYEPFVTVNSGGYCYFDNVYLYKVYAFCKTSPAKANGRVHFGYVQGQIFKYLFWATYVLDTCRVDECHIWPFWSSNANVIAWQQANGDVFLLNRCDGLHCGTIFEYGYRSAFTLTSTADGAPVNVQVGTLYADGSARAVELNGSGCNIAIGNLAFNGSNISDSYCILDNSVGSYVSIGTIRFRYAGRNVVYQSSTTGGTFCDIGQAYIIQYNQSNGGYTIFSQAASAGTHRISLANFPVIGAADYPTSIINSGNSTNLFQVAGVNRTNERTVASLPAASEVGAYGKSYVTDANATTYGSVVAGGGANKVTVYSDGTDWRIG